MEYGKLMLQHCILTFEETSIYYPLKANIVQNSTQCSEITN